jgi:hypothetical protein
MMVHLDNGTTKDEWSLGESKGSFCGVITLRREPWGRKVRPIVEVTAPFEKNSLKAGVM